MLYEEVKMEGWNNKVFDCELKRFLTNTKKIEEIKKDLARKNEKLPREDQKYYQFGTKKAICDYIAKECLNDGTSAETVYGWSRRKAGPRMKETADLLEAFFGVKTLYEKETEKKEIERRIMRYSVFIKEKLFEIHKEIYDYINILCENIVQDAKYENEFTNSTECEQGDTLNLRSAYSKVYERLQLNKVAIPKEVYDILYWFVDECLDKRWFDGEICEEYPESNLVDLQKLDKRTTRAIENEDNAKIRLLFQIADIYEEVSLKCIQPILLN